MNDRQKLETLRISVARIAQALNVTGTSLNVTGLGYSDLDVLAGCNENGWNELASACVEKIDQDR